MRDESENEIRTQIRRLEEKAERVLKLKNELRQRRPIVIEFCGSPKAGKSSCIASLNIFLKRNGFKTTILTERASVCPIPSKHDPFFNIWTLCAAVTEMTRAMTVERNNIDVILADRGIFDSLSWFDWLNRRGFLDQETYSALKCFLSLKYWRSKIDVIFVFTVSPDVSLEREYATLLTRKFGSIMNRKVLSEYLESIERVKDESQDVFLKIESLDTSHLDQNAVSERVTHRILETLEDLLVEDIAFYPTAIKESLYRGASTDLTCLEEFQIDFSKRGNVEQSDFVQPIAIAVLTNRTRDRVLVLKKRAQSTGESSPEAFRPLLYAGGHIRKEDSFDTTKNIEAFSNALEREIEEELGLRIAPKRDSCFVIYTPLNERSNKHVAICFVLDLDLDTLDFRLDEREFIQKTGRTESGKIFSIDEIVSVERYFEPWSANILHTVFGRQVELDLY